jgi:L-threonylcarbamoyladenylate synthase
VGGPVQRVATGPARAPGMLASHYAPMAQVVTAEPADVTAVATLEAEAGRRVALLVQHAPAEPLPPGVALLDPVGDVEGYARCLYRRLRAADAAGADVVVASLPAADGLGAAVRDRLQRASA